MIGTRDSHAFAADNRAVSAVIGFILVFGILMLLLTVYQAQIVPQQNAETEFKHFEDSKNEFTEVRNSIATAGQADVSQFSSVTLGTTYQSRLLTINPAPPEGTIRTSDAYPITIENETGESETVQTRLIEYEPGYNELASGSIWYEHSLLYLDEREQSGHSVIEDQHLVTESGVLRLTALQNEFEETGRDRVTLDLYPTAGTTELPEGELTVELPTRLSESEYWADAFEDDPNDVFEGVEDDAYEDGVHELTLTVEAEDLVINTVGIRTEPDEGPVKNFEPAGGGAGGGGGGGGGGESTEDASVFVSTSEDFNNDNIDTTFDVTDGGETFEVTVNIEESGNDFDEQQININGDSFDLTDEARDDILDDVSTDIMDADNLDAQQSELDAYRDEIDTDFEIQNVDNDGNRDLTTIEVESIE